MWNLLERIFGGGFMPHGHCYLWSPGMVWTQVASNFFIGLAYASIASTLTVLVRRIRTIPFAWAYVSFGVFILSCGLTHWFDILTVWHPLYWADAGVRVLTALASVATAVLIIPLVPKAAALAAAARLSHERGQKLEVALAKLEEAHGLLAEREREAQRRATSSEEQLRSLVQTMPQLAWISAPDGGTVFRNKRWTEYTGLSSGELTERGWEAALDREHIEPFVSAWGESVAKTRPLDIESRMRRADGEMRWFLVRAVPLFDTEGAVTGWAGTCTDIHDQRLLREQALHTAQMKDEFLATVSHELRTPLNAILGWSRVIRAGAVPESMREKALEAVERNAIAQAQLIEDLLDVSRIISGKMRLDLTLMEPSEAVEAAIDAVRPTATAKDVELVSTIDRRAGPVMADGGRLQQIVWNLVANAVKFTPSGGRVTVGVARVEATVEIVVSDTGIGIRADFLPHIFERFSQEDGSIHRKHGGLGLGLAITKHLVELHGGSIRVESKGEGEGSTFVVSLPLYGMRSSRSELRSGSSRGVGPMVFDRPEELRGLTLLLVEDEADSRELATMILSSCGVEVTEAIDAEQALEIVQRRSFDVILSDIGLPGRDGYAFMEALRKMKGFEKVPAAALTAYARPADRRRALSVGYQMHVPKPVEPAELIAVVANLARIASVMKA